MRYLTLLCAIAVCATSLAQRFDPLHPPNTFRNADNPHYWKNDPPFDGYWQQDVHYTIKARLDDISDVAEGSVVLTYWNNSPDTLREVYFHLTQNAYEAGSYMYAVEGGWRSKQNIDKRVRRGTDVLSLSMDGADLVQEIDNTIMRARLPQPIAPGAKVTFACTFRTFWNGEDRRMKLFNAWGHKHYDGTHWYPRLCVYDRKMGWDTQQHLGNEFYGDFGTYDVELDMPNDQIVEATGWLQNPNEVMPADLRAKLDIANFKDKPWNERPSVPIAPDPSVRKLWKYHAENVHDFAFTADPTYRIGQAEWNGVKCIAMAQEPHCSKWQNAADYCARVIKAHSEWFGMYVYPKMVVADARDGMEYPMLTLDGGAEPDYRGLFTHEVGHNWFFGMVGNNETYRAMLDEGFTQFLTSWGLEHIDGDTLVEEPPATAYERDYTKPELVRESEVYSSFMRSAVRDQLPPINTHSDEFGYYTGRGDGGYGHVYFKTATMLYNLQYVLGDSLFQAAMRHYFDQWKIRHPYIEDFRNSIIQFTHVDLNWFFDEWIETGKRIDYAVKKVKHRGADQGQEIVLSRKGDAQMPIDMTVTAHDGKSYAFHIPNTWFVKRTDATVLPRWIGFDELQREYTAHVDIPSGIADVRIDTTYRLADAYQLNNSLRLPFEAEFDSHVRNAPDRKQYEGFVRPDIWYNGYDGVKAGVHFHSDWMRYKHKLWFTAWLNTGFAQNLPDGASRVGYDPISFNLRYENGTERLLKNSRVLAGARYLDGLEQYTAGFFVRPNGRNTEFHAKAKYFVRRDATDLTYLVHPAEWELNSLNGTMELGAEHRYDMGVARAALRSSAPGSVFTYSQLTLTSVNEKRAGPFGIRLRAIAQCGSGDTPRESQLYLASASPEEMMENKYYRSAGLFPYDWQGFGTDVNHFAMGGGLGLRGYAGYLAPETMQNGTVFASYRGNTGAALNAEVDLDGLVRFRPGKLARYLHLDVYLFGDVGSMGYRQLSDAGSNALMLATPRADAGAGAALTIKRFGPLVDIEPLTIRFDMPLVLSNLPAGETEHFAFRYLLAIGRSF